MQIFLIMLQTEQYLENENPWKVKSTKQLHFMKSKLSLLWLCLCSSAEGPHLVSIKVLETEAEWVHFKICSCGKIKWTPRWFCGCSQIYIIWL